MKISHKVRRIFFNAGHMYLCTHMFDLVRTVNLVLNKNPKFKTSMSFVWQLEIINIGTPIINLRQLRISVIFVRTCETVHLILRFIASAVILHLASILGQASVSSN